MNHPETSSVQHPSGSIADPTGDTGLTLLQTYMTNCTDRSKLAQRRERSVHLHLVEVDVRFMWIMDGDTRIGLIDRDEAVVEWIAPHPERHSARPAEIPPLYHAATFQGGRVIAQWWLVDMMGYDRLPGAPYRVKGDAEPARFSTDEQAVRKAKPKMVWRVDVDRGQQLVFTIEQTFESNDAIRGRHQFTIEYDALADSYVADIHAELNAPNHYLVECANFYAGGVYDNRPEMKRYHSTIWAHPDGRLVRWPHNPVSYMTPGMNDPDGERAIAAGGFLGYFDDPHGSPVMEIVSANCNMAGATCCNIYDEHLICLPDEGYTGQPRTWQVHMRMFSVLPSLATQIVDESQVINFGVDPEHPNPININSDWHKNDLSRRLNYNPRFPRFYYDQVNDFETPVPYDQPVVGCCIFASEHPDAAIHWDSERGHSGTRSIRLTGPTDGGLVQTAGYGPTPHIYPDTEYRVSGWICCQDVTGAGAQIRFDEIGLRPREPHMSHVAGPICGTCDWTYFETVFRTTSEAQFGWLYLELNGVGVAWFDDVAVEELRS